MNDAQAERFDLSIREGPGRVTPPCPHYDRCGGCQAQHLDQQTYRQWKEASFRDMFVRAGITPTRWKPSVFIPAGTRRRVTFAALKKGGDILLGFNARRSSQIEDLTGCLLLTPRLDILCGRLRPFLCRILPEGQVVDVFLQDVDDLVEMVLTGDFSAISQSRREAMAEMVNTLGLARVSWRKEAYDPAETLLSPHPLRKTFAGITVDLPPGAFLQPGSDGEAALVEAVLEGCGGLRKAKFADLFCGCGTFTGHLLARGTVYAAESDPASVASLRKAAGVAGKSLQVERRDLFKEPLTVKELNGFDCVVFDPPRAGARALAQAMARSKCPCVIGVSCNPSSFINDARELISGGYRFESLTMVDQFVWSLHSEAVGVFIRPGPSPLR